MSTEVAREIKEGNVLFANGINDADGSSGSSDEANDGAAGAAELSLERNNAIGWSFESAFRRAA